METVGILMLLSVIAIGLVSQIAVVIIGLLHGRLEMETIVSLMFSAAMIGAMLAIRGLGPQYKPTPPSKIEQLIEDLREERGIKRKKRT